MTPGTVGTTHALPPAALAVAGALAALASTVGACSEILPYDRRDLQLDASGPVDAAADRPRRDASAGADAPADSATPPPPPCAALADPYTVALYTFEELAGSTATKNTAGPPAPDGELRGEGLTKAVGPSGCGEALGVPSGEEVLSPGFALLPADPAWQLAEGSIDLLVWFDVVPAWTHQGVISRDGANQVHPGHLTLFRSTSGHVVVRLQDAGTTSYYLCSSPVVAEAWHHVGINFGGAGGLELYVDGRRADRRPDAGVPAPTGGLIPCQAGPMGAYLGLDGNDLPVVVGAINWFSMPGRVNHTSDPLAGRVDQLRISSVRRDFAGYTP